MSRQLQTFRVCDICNREGAGQHSIVHNGQAVVIDLCPDHVRPLEELVERFALATSQASGYSTSPHRCTLCGRVLSRRVHAAGHVQRQHGYGKEESYAYIRPAGQRVRQVLDGPSHQPHRCTICKRPYVNSSTARRHVHEQHPDRIRRGKTAADYVRLIEEDT